MNRSLLLLPLAALLIAAPAVAQDDEEALAPSYQTPAYQTPATLPGTGVNYETRLNSLENQLRAMNGKLEQMEYMLRRQDQTMQRLQTDYEARLAKLETMPQPAATPAPPSAPAPATTASQMPEPSAPPVTEASGTLGALKVQGDRVTGAINSPKSTPLPETPPDYGLTPQEQYDRAFGLLRQVDYAGAEKAFKNFIDKNPQDKMLDSAKYWYAETFYVREKFNDAAVAFVDAYQANPKGNKAPDSLLKLAMSLGAIDKKDDACITLNELKNKYPNAPSVIRARAEQERARLKCASPKPATETAPAPTKAPAKSATKTKKQ